MLWVVIALIVVVIVVLFAILKNLQTMNTYLAMHNESFATLYDEIQHVKKNTSHKAGVTDPFTVANKAQVPGASSKHIIIRKSPDQIRSENYEKIKSGEGGYGQAE